MGVRMLSQEGAEPMDVQTEVSVISLSVVLHSKYVKCMSNLFYALCFQPVVCTEW